MLSVFRSARLLVSSPYLYATRAVLLMGHLGPNDGAVKAYKRLGRGPASKGQKSGRGQKGQKARGKVPHWLEGGQTPYYKRFPIIGFRRPHKKDFHELNVARIQQFWDAGRIPLKEGETLTIRIMRECGLVTGSLKDGVRVLARGMGSYSVPLNVEASKALANAISAIKAAGGTFTSIYHTTLGLRAHVNPLRFLLKKGYVPLQARPMHKRDIAYYSNPEKGGYLLKDRLLLLDHVGKGVTRKSSVTKSPIELLLESASRKSYSDYGKSRIINVADFKN